MPPMHAAVRGGPKDSKQFDPSQGPAPAVNVFPSPRADQRAQGDGVAENSSRRWQAQLTFRLLGRVLSLATGRQRCVGRLGRDDMGIPCHCLSVIPSTPSEEMDHHDRLWHPPLSWPSILSRL